MGWSRGRGGEDPRKFKLNTSTIIIIMLLHFLANYISFWTPHPIKTESAQECVNKNKTEFMTLYCCLEIVLQTICSFTVITVRDIPFLIKQFIITPFLIYHIPTGFCFYLSHMFILNLECITSGKILYTGNCLQ